MHENDAHTGRDLAGYAKTRRIGLWMAGLGPVFGLSPILAALIGSGFTDANAADESDSIGAILWLTVLTLPAGVLIALLGTALVGVSALAARRARRN